MKIVVLAGGTSTERDVSIVSGTGICNGLRAKGHQAILVDVFCGAETVDWADPFPPDFTEQTVRMEGYRPLLTLWESNTQEPDISAVLWPWTKV